MNVATIEVDGPGGRFRLAATGTGLLVVCLPGSSAERFRVEVEQRLAMPPATGGPELQDAGQLLAGLGFLVRHWDLDSATHVHAFPPPLDLRGPAFHRRVWSTLLKVPPGETVTYGRLAELAGSQGAARAVGTAMRSNPVPLFVPCHRVVASNGPGGYGAGLALKQQLLDIEAGTTATPRA